MQLTSDFAAWPLARVDVRVGRAIADRGHDFPECSRLDALSWGCRRSCARTDYLFSGDYACQFGGAYRAGLCAGRAISQVAAQEEADAAVDAQLAEMHVGLLHVALESLVAELPGNRVCLGVDPRAESPRSNRRDGRHFLEALQVGPDRESVTSAVMIVI